MIITSLKQLTYDAIEYFAQDILCPLVEAQVEGERDPNEKPTMIPKAMSPGEQQEAVNIVAGWIAKIPGDVMRDHYIDKIFTNHKKVIGKKANLTNAVKAKQISVDALKVETSLAETERAIEKWLPKDMTLEDVLDNGGFFQKVDGRNTGIYFLHGTDAKSEPEQVSMFTLEPVFHKYDMDDNSRIVKVNNGFEGDVFMEMPTTAFISLDVFKKYLIDRGVYEWMGTVQHLNRIRRAILPKFPKAYEIKTLGWQHEGFFAYYNVAVVDGRVVEYTSAGLVKVGEKYFYSPAISEAFADQRLENDLFVNDRYLKYTRPPINFEGWCALVHAAYGDHSKAMILGVLMSAHRDIHYKIDNNCPHIYFHGETGSGKSKAAETCSNFFFNNMKGFALSAGTDAAFAQRMSRFRNTIVVMNELDTDMVKKERINQLKEAYDGNARERTTGARRDKTESQPVESVIMMVGQFLAMVDDGSLVNRSIEEKYHKQNQRSPEQIAAYEKLKAMEGQGLGGLVAELLPIRGEVEANYYTFYMEEMHAMAALMRKNEHRYEDRVLRNYAVLPTMCRIFSDHFTLPWSVEEVRQWAYGRVVELSAMLTASDVLVKFWTVLEVLASEGILRKGRHYKTENRKSFRVTQGKSDTTVVLTEPRDLMFLRLRTVHQLYTKHCKSTSERPIDINSLENYLRDRQYCLGRVDSEHFAESMAPVGDYKRVKAGKFSAWIIDMEKANIHESGFTSEEQWEEKLKTPDHKDAEEETPAVDEQTGMFDKEDEPF